MSEEEEGLYLPKDVEMSSALSPCGGKATDAKEYWVFWRVGKWALRCQQSALSRSLERPPFHPGGVPSLQVVDDYWFLSTSVVPCLSLSSGS